MKRLFDDHIKRNVTFLDGTWKFACDPDDVGENSGWQNTVPNSVETIVPSVWNCEFSLLEYEGAAWYEKDFYFEGSACRLVFEGVMTECKVWLDGIYIGYHYGGFCEFNFLINDLEAGIHKLILKVDNRFDEASIPQTVVDWYHYGGITRSVSVECLKGVAITYGKFDYTLSEDLSSAEIYFTAELFGADKKKDTILNISIDGKTVFSKIVALRKGSSQTIVTDKIILDDIRLWDIGKPELYTVEFSTDTDDLIDKIGFRSIETKNCKLFLNGREIELRGVNRHEDHPDFGMAFPPFLMKKDLDIIEDMGCNTIRGSHYPNARIFVDMLDSRGILFWSEIPIWGCGFSVEALADKRVVNRGLEMHKEMVRYYYNHPSIVFWGMHNEIRSDSEPAYKMSKLYFEFLKNSGGNRLVTYASDKPMIDICFEFCDIISINQYYGWYYDKISGWDEFIKRFDARRNELGFGNKAVIMSEFGGAAAYGYHTFDNVKWTEEYQAELLSHAITVFHNCPYIVGFYPWQYCDMRSAKDLAKARTLNNKGILNEYRKPKLSYSYVKNSYLIFRNEEKNNG
ncbi:MAG: glycoside hydrolase family 2 TIM barrel-domain containing protein [Acutalibacteraceae bacterium]|nr:glycoside hydrolase family 2 TIM barrel-domain containing protein [Acutalibacteraceae bacterium]